MEHIKEDDIVIRPSGIWDTRSPLMKFIEEHRSINLTYYSIIISINHLGDNWNDPINDCHPSNLFNFDANYVIKNAWRSYKKSLPGNIDGSRPLANLSDLKKTIYNSTTAITEYSIIRYSSIFEIFIRCWTLNYLLTKLERDIGWTNGERNLAKSFSPLSPKRPPNWREICQAIPMIKNKLMKVPHIFIDPRTQKEVHEPMKSKLNAYDVINFWQKWRNLLVHSSGMINQKFYEDYRPFWNDFQSVYPHIKNFETGKRLYLNDKTFRAMTPTYYRAAKSLKDELVKESEERRGHILAPNRAWKDKDGRVPPNMIPERCPPLLLEGDHPLSLLWEKDLKFQNAFRKKELEKRNQNKYRHKKKTKNVRF